MKFKPLALIAGLILSASTWASTWAAEPVPRIGLPPMELMPDSLARFHPADAGPDWGVIKLGAPTAWATTKGKGVRVAVLDTGCDVNHPDLRDRIKNAADVKDFTRSPYGAMDRQGHGTHCAGSVLASGALPGMAPEAELIVVKVLGDNGTGGVDDIASGLRFAAARNADVVSMSLGGAGQDSFIPPALAELEAAGVIVIAAAGNEGPGEGTVGYPGGYRQCVAIGAVDSNLTVARFSSRGPAVFVSGPGVNVRSTYPGGQYATMSGTSMATPNIAGLAALWVAAHPEVPKKERPAKFREAVKAASKDLGPPGRDTAYGWGFPDAVKLVASGSTPAPSAPVEVVIGLNDLTPEARARVLGQFPGFLETRVKFSPLKP